MGCVGWGNCFQGCLPAWHRVMPAHLPFPGRKLQGGGGVAGYPSCSWEAIPGPSARSVSGTGVGGACRLGFGVGGATHCPPPSPAPMAPSREGYASTASGELGGGGSESSRPCVTSQKPPPPPPILAPGESSVLAMPQRRCPCRRGSDAPLRPLRKGARMRAHVCVGCTEAPGDPSPREPFGAHSSSREASPLSLAPPRTDKYLS